jgi:tetratricopeptide (TPR) repeat protein
MDGRRCTFLALALSLGLCGCTPNQMKTAAIEAPPPPPKFEKYEYDEPVSLNPFASKPKREPKLELAMAFYREQKAVGLKDNPEQQFRELDDARKIYQEILVYDNKNIEAYRGLGRIYIAQRDFDRAVATYQKAMELHPKSAQLHADVSVVYSKQNDFATAIQKLNKAREMEPENREVLKMLGVNQVCAGQVELGVESLSRASSRAAAHYYVARLFDRMNQPDHARQHAQMALNNNPDFGDARAFLTELDQRNQRPANAPAVGLQFAAEQ